ncbi:aminomethyltransferase [Streptomyces sp. 846.5]|nr:glycine cleavage system aminomethyltransferase GcvT [Streptomyces sp. 846.5]TDU04071.1 aminomethyltransferase [Streptomyces sp. 846.5]
MTLRYTALDSVHRALGATMTDFAGWDMPLRYGSEREEHNAVRTRAGLFDLSHMGEITVTGPQAGELLDHALVGFVSALAVNKARYTMICAADGGILDDLIVYRTGEAEFLVVANASNAQLVLDELTARADGFDATVRDDRDAYALIAVQGPEATAILAPLTDADLPGLKYYTITPGGFEWLYPSRSGVSQGSGASRPESLEHTSLPATVAGRPALLARTGYTGEDGFELFVAPGDAEPLWHALSEAGAARGLVPCGLSCRDTLRLEAGMPLYGHELSTELTPFDAGLGRVVRFDKTTNGGTFIGREALEKAAELAASHPPRVRVGLVSPGRRVPRAGMPVVAADGAVIGTITSGAPSPTLGKPIAMAYVDAAHAAPGTAVAVDVRGTHEPVEVVALPFYKRAR